MRTALRFVSVLFVGGLLAGAGTPPEFQIVKLASSQVAGLSGLDLTPDGLLLAVAEHQHVLVRIRLTEHGADLDGPPIPIYDIPAELDTESLAMLGPDRIAVGTESQEPERKRDLIYLAHLANGAANVTETIEFPYAPYGLAAGKNHGLESLCAAAGVLVAGSEAVGQSGAHRFAPVGRYDLKTRQWTPFRLRLTSSAGRLASLACRPASENSLEVLAIERQFGVMRLLRFSLPLTTGGPEIEPTIVTDIQHLLSRSPNFEGVAWLPDGRVALISDNEGEGPPEPTAVLLLHLP
jgi:Esterase-like activity of phytase